MPKLKQWTDLVVPNRGINETVSPQDITADQWASGTDVEPLFDGVRRRNGETAKNTTALSKVSIYNDTGASTRNQRYTGQSFTVGAADITCTKVAVRLNDSGASPADGSVTCALYTDNSGVPDTEVTGAAATDFSTAVATDLGTDFSWVEFSLATGVTLSASAVYHVVTDYPNTTASKTVGREHSTTTAYAGGQVVHSTDATTWATAATEDLIFRVYDSPAAIVGIADFRESDGTQKHVVWAGGEVYKLSGAEFVRVSLEKPPHTVDETTWVSWSIGQDRLFYTHNANEVSRKYYDLSGTEYNENEGISPPTVTATAAVSSGGALAAGAWEVDYYYWNDDIGQPSDRKFNGVSALTATTAGTDLQIDITGLPTEVARTGDRATHIRVELKEPGSTLFRLATEIALGTATVTIGTATLTTEAEYRHAVAPLHTIKASGANRQFIAGISGFPYRVQYSEIIGQTPYYESFPADNKRDLGKGEGDQVRALVFVPPRTLLVGMKDSIWALDARTPGTSDSIQIAKDIGFASAWSFIVVGRTVYFISDAKKNKGPFVWEGSGSPKPLLGLDDTFKGLNLSNLDISSSAHYAPDQTRFQWWTLLRSANQTEGDRIIIYDYALGAWTVYTKPNTGTLLSTVESAGVDSLYMGGHDGFEYTQDSGSTDSGTSILGRFKGKIFDFGSASITKKLRYIETVFKKMTSGGVLVTCEVDRGNAPSVSKSISPVESGTVFTLGTSTLGGTDVLGSITGDKQIRRRFRARGKTMQFEFSGTDAWHLKGFSQAVQPMGKERE